MPAAEPQGVDPRDVADDRLVHEPESLHATRVDTLRHGSLDAVTHSTHRTVALGQEYLRRHPDREVDPRGCAREYAEVVQATPSADAHPAADPSRRQGANHERAVPG